MILDLLLYNGTFTVKAACLLTFSSLFWMLLGQARADNQDWKSSTWANPRKFLKSRVTAWLYLLKGREIIQDEYQKANGNPFEVFAPDNRIVFVTSAKHIKEVERAPDHVLSLEAAAEQMLRPQYAFHGYEFNCVRSDQTNESHGTGIFVRVLRGYLERNMSKINPQLHHILENEFNDMYFGFPTANDGLKNFQVYPVMMKLTVLANANACFGKELSSDKEFLQASLDFIEDSMKMAEIINLAPKFLSSYIGDFIASYLTAHKKMRECLFPVIEERLQDLSRKRLGQKVEQHCDMIQWIVETMPRKEPWCPMRILHELLAIWFGSVHGVSTTLSFAIQDLCLHPEYAEPLLNEVSGERYEEFKTTGHGLPLLDSFIKESARHTPLEAVSTRRQALQPFELSDGTKVKTGDWMCTPCHAMMHDPKNYPSPEEFKGFRFVKDEVLNEALKVPQAPQSTEPSGFADSSSSWQMWGNGRACPGRYFATAVIKIVLAHIIREYDVQLVNDTKRRRFQWRSSALPWASTRVSLRPREQLSN